MAVKTFLAQAKSESPLKVAVTARGLSLTVGRGECVSPVECLLGGLAGCINIMGHAIAEEMGIPLKGLTVELETTLDPARSNGEETGGRAGLTGITAKVRADADVSGEVIEKWLKTLQDRSPVIDTLSNPTPMKVELFR